MLGLRTLVVALLLPSLPAHAVTHSLSMTVQSDTRSGPLDIADLNRQFKTNQVTEQLSVRSEGWLESINTQASVFVTQPDYSSLTVRNRSGTEEPLSNRVARASELSTELGVDYAKGQNTISAGWRGSLNDSPFHANLFRGGYTRSFFSQTTALGITWAYLSQAQPESYFTDREFKTHQRPTHINAYETALTYDQVLTENWKMRNRLALGQRIEERPRNLAASTRHSYGITDRLFAALQVTLAQELRGDALKNERGYFTTYGARLGLTRELVYDLLLTASYGLFIEREDDPRGGRIVEVASDQYGLGVSYTFSAIELQAQGSYVVTNTQVNNVGLSGGVSWRM